MISTYDLLYIITKNYCISKGCNNCNLYESKRRLSRLFRMCSLKRYVNPIDMLLAISPNTSKVHPLWNVFMKHCNKHFIYGRFDCCNGCKFLIVENHNKRCIMSTIWENMKLC